MDKSRPRSMDITPPRRPDAPRMTVRPTRRWLIGGLAALVLLAALAVGVRAFQHRNDQRILSDRYQVVYLLTGQVYFGKLQNTEGKYLTLKNVYQLQGQQSEADKSSNTSNIVQVSRQVYGPDDSMAIRADQVQFWQNLRSDSKVAQAIAGSEKK